MRKTIFNIFKKLNNSLKGKGILKNPILNRIYYYLYDRIRPHGFVLVNVNNYKMYVDPSDRGVSLRLLTRNSYENYETTIFKSLIKKGMTVVDVGANIGYYMLLAASLVGREGRVFAFEPEPNNFSMLKKNVEINRFKNIILVRKGVSNKNDTTRLFLNKKSKASHSIYSKIDSDRSIGIELIRLDNFFRSKENSIDAIKIDVEGAEPKVWGGGQNSY